MVSRGQNITGRERKGHVTGEDSTRREICLTDNKSKITNDCTNKKYAQQPYSFKSPMPQIKK